MEKEKKAMELRTLHNHLEVVGTSQKFQDMSENTRGIQEEYATKDDDTSGSTNDEACLEKANIEL